MKKFLQIILTALLVLNLIGTGLLCYDKFFKKTNKYEATYTATLNGDTVTLELKPNNKFIFEMYNTKVLGGDYYINKDKIDFYYIFGFTTDNPDTDTISAVTVREIIDTGTIKTSNNKTVIKIKFTYIENPEITFS